MNRRNFLDPKQLAQTAGQVWAAVSDFPESKEMAVADSEVTLVRYARPAMATMFELVLPFGHCLPMSAIYQALDVIDDLESQLTVYRQTSEVCEVNRRAAMEEVVVSETLFALLQESQDISRETGGAFDVTAGALIKAWGFFRGPKQIPSELDRLQALAATGWQNMELNSDHGTVRFQVAGLEINLGSIGKGYALDQAGTWLKHHAEAESVLLHGGKSSVLASGRPPGQNGWSVAVEHPWNSSQKLVTVSLRDRAMATSAATYKHLIHQGKKLGHILDPRKGWPASGVASATAIAPTATQADALATAFYILGLEATSQYCRQHPEIAAVLLRDGANQPDLINLPQRECALI
jgi:thiamine biosynthesis lipoprotein